MARLKLHGLLLVVAALGPGLGAAQDDEQDLTVPPTVGADPGDARLEPPPDDREGVLEAVVTGGQTDWRLPDLGTELRKKREEEERNQDQRIEVQFLGLFDPENQDPTEALFPGIEDLHNVGFLEIFRLRFGGHPRE